MKERRALVLDGDDTRPTGSPFGNKLPSPEVTMRSPGATWAPSRAMNLKRTTPPASPSTRPGVRVRWTTAPTVEAGSLMSCTTEAPGRTCTTRPTRPSGTITGVCWATPLPRPRFTVMARTQPPDSRPTTSPARVDSGRRSRSASRRRSRVFSCSVSARLEPLHPQALGLGAQRRILASHRLSSPCRCSRSRERRDGS